MTWERKARWERQKPILAMMRRLDCFGHEVCLSPPCACAQEIMDAVHGESVDREYHIAPRPFSRLPEYGNKGRK